MKLTEKFPVTERKIEDLKIRIQNLGIDLNQVEERFIRGSGSGGQKINKTNNCVVLHYPPLEIMVKVQKVRQRSLNRFLALRELIDRVELQVSPQTSHRLKEINRIRKQKDRKRRRQFMNKTARSAA